jgi:Raf kinase inhibitor-like YbhB/YbcL family protein
MRYLALLLLLLFFTTPGFAAPVVAPKVTPVFDLKSPDYSNNARIPVKFTCDGKHVAPELYWENPPAGTQSYTLIFSTNDWPVGPLFLWVVFNIPADISKLPEEDALPDESIVGTNWTDETIYRGPCPPDAKPHRYVFDLYAVDTTLSLDQSADAEQVIAAMRKHILGHATLTGVFSH